MWILCVYVLLVMKMSLEESRGVVEGWDALDARIGRTFCFLLFGEGEKRCGKETREREAPASSSGQESSREGRCPLLVCMLVSIPVNSLPGCVESEEELTASHTILLVPSGG